MKELIIKQFLEILKRTEIKNEIKTMISPLTELILSEIYPYIYIIILFVIFIFFIILVNLILLIVIFVNSNKHSIN